MELKNKIIDELERIEEDCLYSSKGHYMAGQLWVNVNLWIGGIAALLAALAGASALSELSNSNALAAGLSIVAAALTAIMTFLEPSDKAAVHQKAGNQYNALRNESRIFREIEIEVIENEIMTAELKRISSNKNTLNLESPQIPKWAFNKARKGIEEGEADYKVDNNQ